MAPHGPYLTKKVQGYKSLEPKLSQQAQIIKYKKRRKSDACEFHPLLYKKKYLLFMRNDRTNPSPAAYSAIFRRR